MCIVPMWVRFPNLPLELWTQAALSKIGSHVGVPIRTDGITKERLRCSYACALVHVDTSKELLVRSFTIIMPHGGSFEQQVVYESERAKCKLLTHTTEPPTRYSSKPKATKEKAAQQPNCHQVETSPESGVETQHPMSTKLDPRRGSRPRLSKLKEKVRNGGVLISLVHTGSWPLRRY